MSSVRHKVPTCSCCAKPMARFNNRLGIVMYVCSNKELALVRSLAGKPVYYTIDCGLEVDGPKASFEKLAKGECEIGPLRIGTRFVMADAELYAKANALMQADVPPGRLPQLFDDSVRLGLALGDQPPKAIETLSYGIRNKSPRRLDNLGVNMFRKNREAIKAYPDETEDVAWKLFACDMINKKAEVLK